MLKNQVAIVTGAGQGIGFEICRNLARAGARVVLNDINEFLAKEAASKIKEENGICTALAGDASDIDFINELTEEASRIYGKINIAIANAGITMFGDFLTYSPEDFNKVMKVNLHGSFFLAQAAARKMKVQGDGGRIVF